MNPRQEPSGDRPLLAPSGDRPLRLAVVAGLPEAAGCTFRRRLQEMSQGAEVAVVSVLPGEIDSEARPQASAIDRIRTALGDGEIASVLWRPSGAVPAAPEGAEERIRTAIGRLRRDLGLAETVPFVLAETAPFGGSAILDAALERTAASVPWVGLSSARGLDDSKASAERLGERCFRVWKAMSAVSPARREAQAAKYRDAMRVRTRVLLDPGEFLVTSPFGLRTHPVTGEEGRFHAGVDGALWNGCMLLETGICAWRGGTVVEAADTDGPAGTCVAIDHVGGLRTRYFHLEAGSLRVAPGDRVREGSLLGWMGRTGRATGEHLHFQMERDGVPVDPLPLLAVPR